jgi:hypothetical protein
VIQYYWQGRHEYQITGDGSHFVTLSQITALTGCYHCIEHCLTGTAGKTRHAPLVGGATFRVVEPFEEPNMALFAVWALPEQ